MTLETLRLVFVKKVTMTALILRERVLRYHMDFILAKI